MWVKVWIPNFAIIGNGPVGIFPEANIKVYTLNMEGPEKGGPMTHLDPPLQKYTYL